MPLVRGSLDSNINLIMIIYFLDVCQPTRSNQIAVQDTNLCFMH